MAVLAVGELYNPQVTSWPESPQLRLTPDGSELALFYPHITPGEIEAVRYGTAEFTWTDAGAAAVLCFKFGSLNWADCPYEPHRAPPAERGAPRMAAGGYLLVSVVLVEAADGVVQAIRVVGWAPGFAGTVHATVARQLADPLDERAADVALAGLYQYPPDRIAQTMATARCGIPAGGT